MQSISNSSTTTVCTFNQHHAAPPLHHRCNDDIYSRIPDRIFVGLLHATCNEADLQLAFSRYASIRRVEIMRDPSGASKCCGFVTFESIAAADRVLARCATDGVVYRGRRLNIEPAICRKFIDNNYDQHQLATSVDSSSTTMFAFSADVRNLHTFVGNSTNDATTMSYRYDNVDRKSNDMHQRIVSNYLLDIAHMDVFGASKLASPTTTNVLLANASKHELAGDSEMSTIQWWHAGGDVQSIDKRRQ